MNEKRRNRLNNHLLALRLGSVGETRTASAQDIYLFVLKYPVNKQVPVPSVCMATFQDANFGSCSLSLSARRV